MLDCLRSRHQPSPTRNCTSGPHGRLQNIEQSSCVAQAVLTLDQVLLLQLLGIFAVSACHCTGSVLEQTAGWGVQPPEQREGQLGRHQLLDLSVEYTSVLDPVLPTAACVHCRACRAVCPQVSCNMLPSRGQAADLTPACCA